MTVEGQVQGCCIYPISSAGDKDSWSANSRNRTATVISIYMKCNKASTYEMQKMFTHLFHVSWGQCVFSTVMNGKLLINWCNHHTKKEKNRWVFRQNACNRIDEINCHVGAKSLVCLPEHVSHFSTLHQIINHGIYATNYHSQRILWRIPLKTFLKNCVNKCLFPGFPFSHAPLMQSIFLWAQHSSPYFHERMVRLLTIAETNKLFREKPTNHANFGHFKTWVNFLSVWTSLKLKMFDLQGLNFRSFAQKHEHTQATTYYWKLKEMKWKQTFLKSWNWAKKNTINILKIGDL